MAAPAVASLTLAEIVRDHLAEFRRGRPLSRHQTKALRDIARCRTAELGGQRYWCAHCGHEHFVFHSCRNRHCPQCQARDSAEWVEQRRGDLLPTPYFHHVFTLPHEFNPWFLTSDRNQQALLGLLFEAASQTLLTFGRKHLGGQLGVTLVLHTWDQQLRPHYHVHGLSPAGAWQAATGRWIAGGRKFLFPVQGVSRMFRAKFLDGLARLWAAGELDSPDTLRFPPGVLPRAWLRYWRRRKWVIYAQPPFAGPSKLLDYLGRYTHRAAIGHERLKAYDGRRVTFRYRDRADGDRVKSLTLDASEFLARFVTHVLPDRFQRVRHYGFLANRGKAERLANIRRALGVYDQSTTTIEPPIDWIAWLREIVGVEVLRCPRCGRELQCEEFPRPQRPTALASPSEPALHARPYDDTS